MVSGRHHNYHLSGTVEDQLLKGADTNKKYTDRANRATSEQVMDPRTRLMLFKLINKAVMKEANVYHARTDDNRNLAIKIYKTSILIFKDRDRYVSGEFRFRHGYNKHNPRKMVKLWAEKEMRNLKRLRVANVPCPEPILLKSHILIMGFIGNDAGLPAPRLKDADISGNQDKLYWDCVKILRTIYHECHLIHADFSEYNLLYFNETIYVIDVSQSVEHDHPHSLEFLRTDLQNTNIFFRKHGVATLTLRELFDFVTDISIVDSEAWISKMKLTLAERPMEFVEAADIEDSVFKNSYIPRTLDQVVDIERDIDNLAIGNTEELLYTKLAGIPDHTVQHVSSDESGGSSDNDDEVGDLSSDSSDPESEGEEQLTPEELKERKKEWKKFVKMENREKRKTKLKKHLKKRKAKLTKGNAK